MRDATPIAHHIRDALFLVIGDGSSLGLEFSRTHTSAMAAYTMMQLTSTITCPGCGHRASETMPTDACQYFYDCTGCGIRLKPKAGDCCVFCSYGDVPCPPIQETPESDSCCLPSPL